MLRFPLIHPPLLAALGAAGHGGKILLADANYSHSTNVNPAATVIYLNLRPGLVTVDQVLEPVLAAVPVEAVTVMRPDDASTPAVFARYRELLGESLPLRPLGRLELERPASTGRRSVMAAGPSSRSQYRRGRCRSTWRCSSASAPAST